ncbi:MAG: hypothetical protein KGJ07_05435 [Patescibacteria group bacterium]|nr:hypothetical protein [Patescibacteria group bacterium]
MKSVSVVVPVLNEEMNVSSLIKRVSQVLRDKNIQFEVIFIDDYFTNCK